MSSTTMSGPVEGVGAIAALSRAAWGVCSSGNDWDRSTTSEGRGVPLPAQQRPFIVSTYLAQLTNACGSSTAGHDDTLPAVRRLTHQYVHACISTARHT